MSETAEKDWHAFLSGIASDVHKLVMKPANMWVFREKVSSFAERWTRCTEESDRFEAERREHWQRVKTDPHFQDEEAGQPKEGWEWDSGGYLYSLVPGPECEMPAKYTPCLIAALEEDIRQNEQRAQQERSPQSGRDRGTIEHIEDCRRYMAKIRSQYERLTPEERVSDTVRILVWLDSTEAPRRAFGSVCWYTYLDIPEKNVFGCWRPPLHTIPENPCKRLVVPTGEDEPPKANDRAEQYERYYITLAYIHDSTMSHLADSETITRPVWPDRLFWQVQSYFWCDDLWVGPGEVYIETARDEVKAELTRAKETRQQENAGKANAPAEYTGEPPADGVIRTSKVSNLIPIIFEKALAIGRHPGQREELRQAVEHARSECPDILDWIEPHPGLVKMGLVKDVTPLRAVDDAEELLLNGVLAVIAHDSLTPRSIAKIGFHFEDGAQASWGKFDTRAYCVHGVLSNIQQQPDIHNLNIRLLSRILEALESLEAGSAKDTSKAKPAEPPTGTSETPGTPRQAAEISRWIQEHRDAPWPKADGKPAGKILRFDPVTNPADWLGDFANALRSVAQGVALGLSKLNPGPDRWENLDLGHTYWGSVIQEAHQLLKEVQPQRQQVLGSSQFKKVETTLWDAILVLEGVRTEWQERDRYWQNCLAQAEPPIEQTLSNLSGELQQFEDYLREEKVVSRLKAAATSLEADWIFRGDLKPESPESEVAMPSSAVEVDAKDTPAGSNALAWDESNPDFYPFKEAICDAQKIGEDNNIEELVNLNPDKLRALLRKPGCFVRWMTAVPRPRSKVHRRDWQTYLRKAIEVQERIDQQAADDALRIAKDLKQV
jgi:hypothetical protein